MTGIARAEDVLNGHGIIKRIDATQRSITVHQSKISSVAWPEMIVAFRVQELRLLGKLEVGMDVLYTLQRQGEEYVITTIDPHAH
jgi:Cu/Ag efflux protein CusF